MAKITFLGAGSTVFTKTVLGDCMQSDVLSDSQIALYDIDPIRLDDSKKMLENIKENLGVKAEITAYDNPTEAFKDANYIINAIQVGGYEPCTVTDFEIPKKCGLRQTIADTIGIGGIFRALRTIPVMLDYAKIMEDVCPDAWLLNYANPMGMLTGALLKGSNVKTVGLCHSVQVCTKSLFKSLDMEYDDNIVQKVAGINHMGWLLEVKRKGKDIYPEIKARLAELENSGELNTKNLIRLEIMKKFGYYVSESSEHSAEYMPYFIKAQYPELIEKYKIPLDEYPRRCVNQINKWKTMREELINDKDLSHERSNEYASYIIEAMETNIPYEIGGNVINNGLISNLPKEACVEVPCMINGNGVNPCYVGKLPEQLAALNRTTVNVQLLTIEAVLTRKKEYIYHAAMLDPHTSSELSCKDIYSLVDDLIEAHGEWMPEYK